MCDTKLPLFTVSALNKVEFSEAITLLNTRIKRQIGHTGRPEDTFKGAEMTA